MSKKEFEGKVFIVTGASSGIGKATARLAIERGAKVSLVARREDKLREVALQFSPERIEILAADITRDEDRTMIVEQTIKRFGGIDVLVNAAGIIGNGTIENTTLEQWDTMFDTNLRSLFRLTQLALPSIIERKGNIVNVSSVTGVRSFPNVLAYCVSKAGVDQLTHC
ncbi:MAG: SDR family NAD(P)-dependent oxidoreductase, partial [Ignavibacteriae bacterium]|nr:SDR family NAD(P)-dependent oxidoreductase [Ignavibacteriota bacterium]